MTDSDRLFWALLPWAAFFVAVAVTVWLRWLERNEMDEPDVTWNDPIPPDVAARIRQRVMDAHDAEVARRQAEQRGEG